MKGNIIPLVLVLVLFIFMMLFIILTVIDVATEEIMRSEFTDCYDKYGNKIIGEKCIDKIYCGVITKIIDPNHCYGN